MLIVLQYFLWKKVSFKLHILISRKSHVSLKPKSLGFQAAGEKVASWGGKILSKAQARVPLLSPPVCRSSPSQYLCALLSPLTPLKMNLALGSWSTPSQSSVLGPTRQGQRHLNDKRVGSGRYRRILFFSSFPSGCHWHSWTGDGERVCLFLAQMLPSSAETCGWCL